MISTVGLINLLEQLTGIKGPIYSLDYLFITKNIKEYKEIARWKDAQGKVCW